MLVPAMNEKEINVEVIKDFLKIFKSTLPRLSDEYHKERKKLEIDKERTYQRCYKIRTASKNNWLLFIEKSPTKTKYKNVDDTVYCAITYYHTAKGMRVFKPLIKQEIMIVYNGHVFSRYNERLGLNLDKPMDILQHFFAHCGYSDHKIVEKKNRFFSFGVCKDGILLGDYLPEQGWLINKTFVSRNIYHSHQDETEKELIEEMQKELDEAIAADGNTKAIRYHADTYEAIMGKRKL